MLMLFGIKHQQQVWCQKKKVYAEKDSHSVTAVVDFGVRYIVHLSLHSLREQKCVAWSKEKSS